MFKRVMLLAVAVCGVLVAGCATVALAPPERDSALKAFPRPPANMAGLYVYRNSLAGQAFKKNVYVDKVLLGETANKTYFYKEIAPGEHEVSTESEFSDNSMTFQAEAGKNYFVRQYLKMGVFVGGANVELVSEQEGMDEVRQCRLAK